MAAEEAAELPCPSEDEPMEAPGGQQKRKQPLEEVALAVSHGAEATPAWMQHFQEQFQMVLRSEVRDISNSVSAMGDQLQREREDRKQDISEVHKRLDELNGRIDAVSKGSRADHGFSAVPPPSPMPGAFVASNDVPTIDPWMRYREQRAALGTSAGQAPTARHQDFPSPPSALKPDANDTTDYNHIVVGGWENDTPKKHIQDAITENLAHWDQAERAAVSKVVVYNQRARTGHVFLQSLPPDQARARFYAIQEKHGSKVRTNTGTSYFSPSKPPEVRKKNRATREIGRLIAGITGSPHQTDDVDWSRQIIWCGKTRVAAVTAPALMAARDNRLMICQVRDEYGEHTPFHVNLTALASAAGKPVAEVERQLASP